MNTHGTRPRLRDLILPYWTSRDSWRGWILLAIKVVLMFTSVYLAVWSNKLSGQVVDAMVKREWDGLLPVLALAWTAGMLTMLVSMVVSFTVLEFLQYEWRTSMTRWFLHEWTRHRTYYAIERDGCVDNADQRISQDIARFVELTLFLLLNPIHVVVSAVSFTFVLWKLSGTLSFTFQGIDFAIPGYMVYLVYAYSAGALLVSHLAGRPLIKLFNVRQTVEANFRYQGMQLRENAEQIAFYDGGDQERRRMEQSFEAVRENWRAIIFRTVKMVLARETYLHTGSLLPTAAALPRYLSGAISMGDVTRISGAFVQVSSSLTFFTQAYANFTEWWALGNRLRDLLGAVEAVRAQPTEIHIDRTGGTDIAVQGLTLRKPGGEPLASIPPLRLQQGERWLLRGTSGAARARCCVPSPASGRTAKARSGTPVPDGSCSCRSAATSHRARSRPPCAIPASPATSTTSACARCCARCVCPSWLTGCTTPTAGSRSSRAESSSGWPSAGPCCSAPTTSSSTRPPARSTRTRSRPSTRRCSKHCPTAPWSAWPTANRWPATTTTCWTSPRCAAAPPRPPRPRPERLHPLHPVFFRSIP